MTLVLRGDMLIDGTGAPPVRDAAVVVQGGIIVGVGQERTVSVPEGPLEVMDLRGRTILPGLIDAHVHLVFSAGEDPRLDLLAEDDDQLFDRAVANAQGALCAGFTLLRDCGGRGTVTQQVRDAIASGRVVGPRILSGGVAITTPMGHLHFMGMGVAGVEEVTEAVRGQLARGVDFIKVMASGGNMTPGSDHRLAQYSEEELRALVEQAHDQGKVVAAHVHSAEAIRRAFEAGIDTFEHCSWVGQDGGDGYDGALVKRMARKGVVASPAVGNTYRQTPEELSPDPARQAFYREFRKNRFGVARRMHEAGVRLIFGTDAGTRRTRFQETALSFPIFVEHFGLTPLEAIVAATGQSAEVLGVAGDLGTLQVGKKADLVVVDGDPVVDLSALCRVHMVFRQGELVAKDGAMVA